MLRFAFLSDGVHQAASISHCSHPFLLWLIFACSSKRDWGMAKTHKLNRPSPCSKQKPRCCAASNQGTPIDGNSTCPTTCSIASLA